MAHPISKPGTDMVGLSSTPPPGPAARTIARLAQRRPAPAAHCVGVFSEPGGNEASMRTAMHFIKPTKHVLAELHLLSSTTAALSVSCNRRVSLP